MPTAKLPTADMGRRHEEYLARINDGRKTKSSGNQWDDQGDGRNAHDLPFAFCWDGKSTLGKSISITLEMLAKIREQAQGERPEIGLRWYGNEALTLILEDWVAIPGADWEEVLAAARRCAELEAAIGGSSADDVLLAVHRAASADEENYRLREELEAARNETAMLHRALKDAHRAAASSGAVRVMLATEEAARVIPGALPRLPWTVVTSVRLNSSRILSGVRWGADGIQRTFEVAEAHVDRGTTNRPVVMVNDVRERNCDLFVDGRLRVRACADDRSIEVG